MKTTIRLSFILIIVLIAYSCFPMKEIPATTSTIVPLSDTVTIGKGALVYALPRTVLTITVDMERTIEKPGPYAKFAGDLLGLNNVIQNENEFWSILSIRVKSHEELDPSEYYVVKSNNIFVTNILSLKREGLILDINPSLFNNGGNQIGISEQEAGQFNTFDLGSDEYFQLQRDTAYRRVNVDSLFIRIPYIVEKKKKLTVDQLADRAAKQLMELREGKHMILTGEATVFPQNDAAINEINRMEKEYLNLFAGRTWSERKTITYQIIPDKGMVGKPVEIFRFSELTGPLSASMKGGIQVSAVLSPEQKTKPLTILNKQQDYPTSPVYDKLLYRVPEVVNIKISMDSEVLFSSRRLVYQFGEVIQLPANYIIGK